jgi:hypothetical protein
LDRIPEGREWGLFARVIPHACGNRSSVAGDTRHLGQSAYGLLHEVDDQLGERSIELAITERQPLRSSDPHLHAWMPLCSSGGELLRRINRGD